MEITAYASALLRARMGVLSPELKGGGPVRKADDAGDLALASSAPEQVISSEDGRTVVRQGRCYPVAPAMLDRFCQLTGISPGHIGGTGSNLAGIAFYFAAFAILTGGRDVSLERLECLLDQLRACREAIDRFVARRLNSAGWTPQGHRSRTMALALQELGLLPQLPPATDG